MDVHTHIEGTYREDGAVVVDYEAAAVKAIELMDAAGIDRALVLPPPISGDPAQRGTYDYRAIESVIAQRSDRLSLIAGGGLLNPIINLTAADAVDETTLDELRADADAVIAAGAVAFGEMAALHLSFNSNHPFEQIDPDHPLLLELADISADSNLPIDLHMEAVVDPLPLPDRFSNPPNPTVLDDNIAAFERLLDHNPDAKIVWAHIGWDNTGDMTPELVGELMSRHPNLYASLRVEDSSNSRDSLVDPDGAIDPEWLDVLEEHPDRFVVGADEFIGVPSKTVARPQSLTASWGPLDELPGDLAVTVACENPRAIYPIA